MWTSLAQLLSAIVQALVAWQLARSRADDRQAGRDAEALDRITAAEKDEARAKDIRLRLRARRAERLRQAEQPVGSVQPGPGNGPGAAG
jgi:hypothetical protein